MAVLDIQDGSEGLEDVTFVAADAGGDDVASGAIAGGWELGVVLLVQNGDTVAHTVTVEGNAFVVPATAGRAIVPIRGGVAFGDVVTATYDAVTSVTVAAVRLASL